MLLDGVLAVLGRHTAQALVWVLGHELWGGGHDIISDRGLAGTGCEGKMEVSQGNVFSTLSQACFLHFWGTLPPPPSPILLLSRTYYVLAATLNVAYIINSFRPNVSL